MVIITSISIHSFMSPAGELLFLSYFSSAKLVNITGGCSLIRGQWEKPIILTFDEGMDELDDLLIQPTNVIE